MLIVISDEETAEISFDVKRRTVFAHLNILKVVEPDLVSTNIEPQGT
jgi:hypothetical protein